MSRRETPRRRKKQIEDPLAIEGESYDQALIECEQALANSAENTFQTEQPEEICKILVNPSFLLPPESSSSQKKPKSKPKASKKQKAPEKPEKGKNCEIKHQKNFAKKLNETPEQREARLQAERDRQAKLRRTETPEQRLRRLENQRQRQIRFRQRESEKQHQKRLEEQRVRQANRRQVETPEEYKKRKEWLRNQRALKKVQETPLERELRLIQQRKRQATRLQNETPEKYKQRVEEQRIRQNHWRLKRIEQKLRRLAKRLIKKCKYLRQKCADYKMTWGRDTTLILVSFFQSEPILYDPSHENYEDQTARQDAYMKIFKGLKNKKEDLTISGVKRKIRSLRSEYLREKWNYNRCMSSGENQNYKPQFWLFEKLRFLDNYPSFPLSPNRSSRGNIEGMATATTTMSTAEASKFRRKRRRQAEEETQELIRACTNLLASPTVDEYEALGINVQAKLRKMNQSQQVHAEKIINKVLMLGMLGKLQQETDLTNYSQVIPIMDVL